MINIEKKNILSSSYIYTFDIYIHLKNSLNNCVYADLKWSERGN